MLIVKIDRSSIEASQIAAESHGFAANWGGRQLRGWTRRWLILRELPQSLKGCHAKVYSLLSDPVITAELQAYVRSNKWAMDPIKLAAFTENKLVPSAVNEYLQELNQHEMPSGLKKYMALEIFSRNHIKVRRGVSLSTAHCWLHSEGFHFVSHKKRSLF